LKQFARRNVKLVKLETFFFFTITIINAITQSQCNEVLAYFRQKEEEKTKC
jgi:hypothetical protein